MTLFRNPAVIINLASGNTSDVSEEVAAVFTQHDFPAPKLHVAQPSQLRSVFGDIARDGTDLLIVYGGDGTCKSGAVVARDLDIPFIALPGGTMNLLPRALYGTDIWQDALDLALNTEAPRWFPAGRMNDEIFFCGAIIGDPIKMSDARESMRDGKIVDAVKQIPEVVAAITEGQTFTYEADGKDYVHDTNLLNISSPKAIDGSRSDLAFEVASVPRMRLVDLLDVGARSLIMGWRESEKVRVTHVKTLSISGQGDFEALLDGEPARVSCPIKVTLDPRGVEVLAPELD